MRKTIAVDLDGVLAQYTKWEGIDKIGDPIDGAQTFMKRLSEVGNLLVYTTRCNANVNHPFLPDELRDKVIAWLDEHGFVYHDVYIGQGKPLAAVYIDDKAVRCRPMFDDDEYRWALEEVADILEFNV